MTVANSELLGAETLEQVEGVVNDALPANIQLAGPVTMSHSDSEGRVAGVDSPVTSALFEWNSSFVRIVERFMPRLEEQLDAMNAAVVDGDMSELAASAHWLKGSGGNVGFGGFSKPAARLQAVTLAEDQSAVTLSMTEVQAYAVRGRAGCTLPVKAVGLSRHLHARRAA